MNTLAIFRFFSRRPAMAVAFPWAALLLAIAIYLIGSLPSNDPRRFALSAYEKELRVPHEQVPTTKVSRQWAIPSGVASLQAKKMQMHTKLFSPTAGQYHSITGMPGAASGCRWVAIPYSWNAQPDLVSQWLRFPIAEDGSFQVTAHHDHATEYLRFDCGQPKECRGDLCDWQVLPFWEIPGYGAAPEDIGEAPK